MEKEIQDYLLAVARNAIAKELGKEEIKVKRPGAEILGEKK